MIELKQSIPQRINLIRNTAALALVVSFFLSFNLWWGNNLFPKTPFSTDTDLPKVMESILSAASVLCLLISIVANKHRIFIFLSISINTLLVLDDTMRLQPWFLLYNAILLVAFLFNGRVDDPNHYTYLFIILQLIVGSVYLFNGLFQAFNPHFLNEDYLDTIRPLMSLSSERQFLFFIKAGKVIPYLSILTGLLLLVPQARFISIPMALFFHLCLLVLIFPSSTYDNKSSWFLHGAFVLLILFLFSGQTKQRYFSLSILFQKPAFYAALAFFWITPCLQLSGAYNEIPGIVLGKGRVGPKEIPIEASAYHNLPLYVKHFCTQNEKRLTINLHKWCSHELNAELVTVSDIPFQLLTGSQQGSSPDVKEHQDELSSL